MELTLLTKRPGESRLYDFDFAGVMATGETISTVTGVTATPTGLTVGATSSSGTIAQVRLSGGTDRTIYELTCTVTTSASNTLELVGRLQVRDGTSNVDATVSGAAANSYVTLAEANAYFATRVGGEAWSELDETDAENALITATAQLEMRKYVGGKTTSTQALKWPRWGIEDEDAISYASDAIPARVKQACFELALYLAVNPGVSGATGLEGFKSIELDQGTSFQFAVGGGSSAGTIPSQAMVLINDFLLGDQAKILRA